MTKRANRVESRLLRSFHPNMPIARYLSRPHLQIAVAYLGSYVALDWLSFVHPFGGLAITPWDPQPGLSIALILLFGRQFIPWLFVAALLADAVVRDSPLTPAYALAAAAIIGLGYGAATSLLLTRFAKFDVALSTRRDLLCLLAVATAAAGVVALSYVSLMVVGGFVQREEFVQAAVRYWVGDAIGIAVVTPFLLIMFTRRRLPVVSWELIGPLALLAGSLWLVVGVESLRFQLFYLLFLPVIWTAVRFGLEGVVFGLAITQLSLLIAVHFTSQSAIDVTAFQALMLVLAVTGLAVGVIVSEQQRIQHQLRLHQDALARAMRLASMGEFAAALAHEINQPLTAIANYARLAQEAASAQSVDVKVVAEATAKSAEQVERAADVIRRLREFIQLGRSESLPVLLQQAIPQVQKLIRADLEQQGIALEADVPHDLPPVTGNSLQLEQVLMNLLRNSMESIVEAGRYDGRIMISARPEPAGHVTMSVRDNGPGFGDMQSGQVITPFATTKPDGLGLGLALSRSIIEAHGGRLRIAGDATGAIVSFELPIARERPETEP